MTQYSTVHKLMAVDVVHTSDQNEVARRAFFSKEKSPYKTRRSTGAAHRKSFHARATRGLTSASQRSFNRSCVAESSHSSHPRRSTGFFPF